MSDVHVGNPPEEWEGEESRLIHFHQFEGLPSKKKDVVYSPTFSLFNHDWSLQLSPGGNSEAKKGRVSLFLKHISSSKITVSFDLLFKASDGVADIKLTSPPKELSSGQFWGWKDATTRSALKSDEPPTFLTHGTLTVEVRMKLDEKHRCKYFIPKNPFVQCMLKLFLDDETADVSFEVQGKIFCAHKIVIKACAPGFLSSLCESCTGSSPVVSITNVDKNDFHHMLYYVYGGHISAEVWERHSQTLIEAADKYELKSLKIEAEAWYLKQLKFKVEEVVETVAYADKMNCFLLKEAAIDFIVENADEVLSSDSFENLPHSKIITEDILFAIASKNKKDKAKKGGDVTKISINDLRAKLYDKGKDIDGSRKMLIGRLKE